MAKLTEKEKKEIVDLYLSGMSYKEVQKKTKRCYNTISKSVKGLRTHSESVKLSRSQGKGKLTEKGRLKLSECGKKACKKNRKFWTKPEREFKNLLNEVGIGVNFPDYVKEILNLEDDKNATVYFQYPIQRYICDFVDVKNKIVFRINGDFWHGNPLLYSQEKLTKIQKFNIQRDKNKKIFLEKNEWTVIDIWESDIYWRQEYVKKQVTRGAGNPPLLYRGDSQFKSEVAYSSKEWQKKLNDIWFKKPKGRPKKEEIEFICKNCGKIFKARAIKNKIRKYCNQECYSLNQRKVKNRPNKEQLLREIKESNYCAIGRKYGVSDNCIRKWLEI